MRVKYLVIPAALCALVILALPVNGAISIFGDHFSPAEPDPGDEVEFFVIVRDPTGIGIVSVSCQIDNTSIDMETYLLPEQEHLNWTEGVLYKAIWEAESGDHNVTYKATDSSGNVTTLGPIQLSLDEEKTEDTIFGLPKTYCAISVIFITLMIIFLTWSYFKGRRMQKEIVDPTGSSMMSCSACGARISMNDEKCPKCGAEFEEEEHVCGNCGGVISEDDKKCPKCGTKLRIPASSGSSKPPSKDRDLMKLKDRKVNMTGKVKCRKCGAVYLKKEGACPECSEE